MDPLIVAGVLIATALTTDTPDQLDHDPLPPLKVTHVGSLGRQAVRYYIRLRRQAIRSCYVQELGSQPGLQVRVPVEFTIEASGKVTTCRPGTTPLERCVAREVCAIRFPRVFDRLSNGVSVPGTGTTDVRYAFKFRPRPRDGRERRRPAAEEPRHSISRPQVGQASRQPRPASVSPRTPGTAVPTPHIKPPPVPPAPAPSRPRLPTIPLSRTNDPLEGIDL